MATAAAPDEHITLADAPVSTLPKEVCVFLLNQSALCVPVRHESKKIATEEILKTVHVQLAQGVRVFRSDWRALLAAGDPGDVGGEQRSKSLARNSDFFALWITSPLLELQLMRKQRPFHILAKWGQLLAKYTTADNKTVEQDEPALTLQRNVFLNPLEDQTTEDPNVLELLYEEAKTNILDGRYPCDEYEHMAALQAAIDIGPYDPQTHTPEYFRLHSHHFLPLHYRLRPSLPVSTKSQWFKPPRQGRTASYERLVEHYRLIDASPRATLIRKYLEKCWRMDYYGAAFFTGQMERATRGVGLLVNHHDKKVWVAINHYGIHLIDQKICVSAISAANLSCN